MTTKEIINTINDITIIPNHFRTVGLCNHLLNDIAVFAFKLFIEIENNGLHYGVGWQPFEFNIVDFHLHNSDFLAYNILKYSDVIFGEASLKLMFDQFVHSLDNIEVRRHYFREFLYYIVSKNIPIYDWMLPELNIHKNNYVYSTTYISPKIIEYCYGIIKVNINGSDDSYSINSEAGFDSSMLNNLISAFTSCVDSYYYFNSREQFNILKLQIKQLQK